MSVKVIFYIKDLTIKTLLFQSKNNPSQFKFFSAKLNDRDAYSSSITAARAIAYKLKLDMKKMSFCTESILNQVNWEKVQEMTHENFENPQLFLWSHYLNECPLWNSDDEKSFFLFVRINNSDLEFIGQPYKLVELDDLNKNVTQKTIKLIEDNDLIQVLKEERFNNYNKTFIYFCFKEGGNMKYSPPRPFLDTPGIYYGIFRRRQERWLKFNFPSGQYPNDEQLEQAECMILPGSGASSYNDKQWIRDLEEFIRQSYQKHKHLRILAICFGLQVVSQAFGGKVEPLPQRKYNKSFYLRGNTELTIDSEQLMKTGCFKEVPSKMIINKAHGDHVVSYNEQMFQNVGTSEMCYNEIIKSKDHRILGFQSHPEFSTEYQYYFVSQLVSMIEDKSAEEIEEDFRLKSKWVQESDPRGRQMCFEFIKNK